MICKHWQYRASSVAEAIIKKNVDAVLQEDVNEPNQNKYDFIFDRAGAKTE